ncbi:MAG: hypothetical protein IJZ15_00225 [Oscillospiraceae bacterium]|nr:hypothetical protein [Oscillospiraceae bacterium]
MQGIKEYLFGVIAAAILCAIVSQLVGKDGLLSAAVKLITGIFMLLTLVSPVLNLKISAPGEIFSDISLQADQITSSASDSTRETISGIIKEKTEAYILDKANLHGAALTVDVSLSESEIPEPVSVQISGNVSPYTRKILSETIEKDLGIATEAQIWN